MILMNFYLYLYVIFIKAILIHLIVDEDQDDLDVVDRNVSLFKQL